MDVKLHPEIWLLLEPLLHIAEISRLSRATHYLQEIFRPIIYRDVSLAVPSHVDAPLQLLLHDPTLATSVKAFQCFEPSPDLLSVILKMTAVNSLRISIRFASEVEQQEFVEHFQKSDSHLEELTLYSSKFRSNQLNLPRLKTLSWQLRLGKFFVTQSLQCVCHHRSSLQAHSSGVY
jgi:hypothetical protein